MPDWNEKYMKQDTPWDLGGPSAVIQRLVGTHRALWQSGRGPDRIVVPGAGLGHDVKWLIEQGCDVTAVDLAPEAIRRLREYVGDHPRLHTVVADFLVWSADCSHPFDAMVEHTFYCALDPSQWDEYRKAVRTVVRPGGILMGAYVLFEGGGPPFGTSIEALRRDFAVGFDILQLEVAPETFSLRACPQAEAAFRVSA